MNKIQQDILRFVENMAITEGKKVEDVITEYNLHTVLYDVLKNVQDRACALEATIWQEKRNDIFIQEMKELTKLCANDSFLVLKGLANAYYLYEKPSMRISGDIDILVEDNKCSDIEDALCMIGYTMYKPTNMKYAVHYVGNLYSEYIKKYGEMFDEYAYNHRVFWKDVNGFRVEIEIHKYLCGLARNPQIYYPEIFATKREVAVCSGLFIKTLSIENTLLYMVCHMTKHIGSRVRNPKNLRHNIDMKTLLDIKLLVEKNGFTWKTVVDKSKKWGVAGSLLLGLKMVNYVFPETIPEELINYLYKEVHAISEKKSHESLINGIATIDAAKLSLFDLKDFFRLETIDKNEMCHMVRSDFEHSDVIELHSSQIDASLRLCWTEQVLLLDVHYSVKGDIVVLGFNLCSDISHLYSTNLFLIIKDGKVELVSKYMDEKINEHECEILERVQHCGESKRLIVTILWEWLNIFPRQGEKLPFGFKVLLLDYDENFLDSISLPTNNYYDCYGLSSIQLM